MSCTYVMCIQIQSNLLNKHLEGHTKSVLNIEGMYPLLVLFDIVYRVVTRNILKSGTQIEMDPLPYILLYVDILLL